MALITLTKVDGGSIDINSEDIASLEDGKSGGFVFAIGDVVDGQDPLKCTKITLKNGKTLKVKETKEEIKNRIV